ncbi:MAG: tetratricopeptide repeat protein [Treponema sp.]|jgi:tetratricopeptide (TPR) repeat protein|nr:tetratricopeptide repeat protein [Treponema sp.]
MPSLQQLENFKVSFLNIGNEAAVLAERRLAADNLPLPDTEPVPMPEPENAGGGKPDPGFPLPGAEDGGDNAGDFDFGAFLDTIPDDLVPPPEADIPDDFTTADFGADESAPDAGGTGDFPGVFDAETGDSGGDFGLSGFSMEEPGSAGEGDTSAEASGGGETEDFGFPGALLDGLAGGIEPEHSDGEGGTEEPFPGLEADSAPAGPAEDFSISGMDDFDSLDLETSGPETESAVSPEESVDAPPEEPEIPDFGIANLPDEEMFSLFSEEGGSAVSDTDQKAEPEASGTDIDLMNSVDFSGEAGADFGAEEASFGEISGFESAGDMDLSIPDPENTVPPAEDAEDNFSIPETGEDEFMDFGGEAAADTGTPDAFDAFNLEGEAPDFGTGNAPLPAGEGIEDFSLAGIDDPFSVPGPELPGVARGAGQASPEVEEINLSEEDFTRLQETLASYPLNLRIACEELIAEQAVAPDLMSSLIKHLIRGAPAKETAALAGKILNKTIPIPKGFEKKTGMELEEEQASFAYIFIHKFLPVFRVFLAIALAAVSLLYLIYHFVYTPLAANALYKDGYERIPAGEYARANEQFRRASLRRRMKKWYYRYAQAFRKSKQYIFAGEKYQELLWFYPRDKQGALDYADMTTNELMDYALAEQILRRNILDYAIDDREGLTALGDNFLAWGEEDPSKYEAAREAYARLLEKYGRQDPYLERMLLYFIRTDNLGETITLQQYFMDTRKSKISAPTLAELGGYLLDKRSEEVRGVPDENLDRIDGIRDILFRAIRIDPDLPEPYYHLARYYNHFGNSGVERETLETAIRAFDAAAKESAKRTHYRLDTERRYAQILIGGREFFRAEEHLTKAVGIYEDALDRDLLKRAPEYGRLYADLADLEYFTKDGNMEAALQYYRRAEQNGWAPPEIQYRIGSVYYHLRMWGPALERFFTASASMPLNRRILHALGNTAYLRGDYFAAQSYYNRLLDLLEAERARLPMVMPNDKPEHMQLAERLMIGRNNLGVTLEALAETTGNTSYRSRALALFAESARAWDSITRNPDTMARMRPTELYSPGVNLGFLNSQNILHPVPGYEPQIFIQIDKDALEPSAWEDLAPPEFRLSRQ